VVPPENLGVLLSLLRTSQSCHVENVTCRLHDSSHEKEGPREGNISRKRVGFHVIDFSLSLFLI